MPHPDLKETVKSLALEMGFDLVRVTTAQEFTADRQAALERIQSGQMDGLPWYTPQRVIRGSQPQELLPGARSVICLGLNYYPGEDPPPAGDEPTGKIARYARGRDYHRLIKSRMKKYVAVLRENCAATDGYTGQEIAARWYVDDGPMLDRAAANRAGLGWFGKNSNILTPQLGSWVFLGQVITNLAIPPDPPLNKTCGNCARCIPACPTGAIVAPYVIDNSRCISHLTIENRGPIPPELRPLMGDWVFGCDICQEVCPVNRKAKPTANTDLGRQELATVDLITLLQLSDAGFLDRFRGTPIMRAKRVGMQRNACVAIGNRQDPIAIPALSEALLHAEPLVRSHAAWALGQIGGTDATAALQQAASHEQEPQVQQEIRAALTAAAEVKAGVKKAPSRSHSTRHSRESGNPHPRKTEGQRGTENPPEKTPSPW